MGKDKLAKLDGKSADIANQNIQGLKSLFPQVVKDGKADFEALKLALGSEIEKDGEGYGLNWAGKSECFRHIQETTTATLKPDRKESVDFDNTENIFIEGDNLEVLKVLQTNYYGKVKMIYIDPPYNTGNDSFIYPDKFKEEKGEYEQRAGIKDAEGFLTKDGFWRKNSKDSGHFHSNWLCMMYPRLFLVRNLLRDDGVIFVSIDDNEVHNLRMIMNEVFGEENFVASIIWEKKFSPQNDDKYITPVHDYILVYARSKDNWTPLLLARNDDNNSRFQNPDNDPRGVWSSGDMTSKTKAKGHSYKIISPTGKIHYPPQGRQWASSETTCKQLLAEERIWFGEDGNSVPRVKQYLSEVQAGIVPMTLWKHSEVGHNQEAKQELNAMFHPLDSGFETPKPIRLNQRMLEIAAPDDAVVLDFFAGTCTMAHAVMQLNAEDGGNRKFICVQLAESCEEETEAFKAGFKTIADIGRERIRRAAKKIKEYNKGKLNFDGGKLDLGFKAFKLADSSFKQWKENIKTGEELKKQLEMFVDNKNKDAKPEDMLYEIILKNSRFDLNVPAEKKTFDGIEYYSLAGGEEIICLAEKITKKLTEKILKDKPKKFTCLDGAFKDNDQLKTNTALQMDAAKFEFKVV